MAEFAVDPAFVTASEPVASLKLCEVRFQNDARWPWLILIPRRPGAREIDHLAPADRAQLYAEITLASAAVRAAGAAIGRAVETLNVAKIGNLTPQLHLHVVGRRPDDPLWPAPPWGQEGAHPYAPDRLEAAIEATRHALQGAIFSPPARREGGPAKPGRVGP